MNVPRVMIAGTRSGCGKTTAVCAVLALMRERGLQVSALKCGPDYIDPMFHREVLGEDSANLDPFFCDGELLRSTLARSAGRDAAVIEGVMGYYDGTGPDGLQNSSWTVARSTDTPVVLLIEGRGAAASALAILEGFLGFVPESGIMGVIISGVSQGNYNNIERLMARRLGDRVRAFGFIPRLPEGCVLPSRHLGLTVPEEQSDLPLKLAGIADICRETLDIEGLLSLARGAPELRASVVPPLKLPSVKVAVARDAAFSFIYPDTIKLFCEMGAEIVYFSPLANDPVPEGASGLYLPGGYPELCAPALMWNRRSAESVYSAVTSGMPTIAECGGFLYLGETLEGCRMCGVLPMEGFDAGNSTHLGYVTLTTSSPGLFGGAGIRLPAHEFHYCGCTDHGHDLTALRPDGSSRPTGFYSDTLYAGFPHLYLPACVPAAESYLRKCAGFREKLSIGGAADG